MNTLESEIGYVTQNIQSTKLPEKHQKGTKKVPENKIIQQNKEVPIN